MQFFICTFKVPGVTQPVRVKVSSTNANNARGEALELMVHYGQIRRTADAECIRVEEESQ